MDSYHCGSVKQRICTRTRAAFHRVWANKTLSRGLLSYEPTASKYLNTGMIDLLSLMAFILPERILRLTALGFSRIDFCVWNSKTGKFLFLFLLNRPKPNEKIYMYSGVRVQKFAERQCRSHFSFYKFMYIKLSMYESHHHQHAIQKQKILVALT